MLDIRTIHQRERQKVSLSSLMPCFLLMILCMTVGSVRAARAVGPELHEMPIRGIVRAVKMAEISTDLSARAKALHVRVADTFKQGDILVEFDCEQLAANRDALRATHQAAKVALKSQQRLFARGATGRQELQLAEIEVKKTASDERAVAARIKHCTVAAPFDGRVAALRLREFETPQTGQVFMSLVGVRGYEVDIIVPSRLLSKFTADTHLDLEIDETGLSHRAKVDRVGAAVDPVSQTVRIVAVFSNSESRVLPGMSGTATFHFSQEVQ